MMPADKKTLTFLFLGGAKRVRMARLFKAACAERGFECQIIGYELSCNSALAAEGIIVRGLRWGDANIYKHIDSVVEEYDVDVILPFVDAAVGVAAGYIKQFGDKVFSPVSDVKTVETMFDKIASAELFERLALPIPSTYRPGQAPSGLIAKPRYGSASKGIVLIDTIEELNAIRSCGDNYLIQKRIDSREEITVDCYVSMTDGRILAVSPRLRCEVSGGEVVRTITIFDTRLDELSKRVLAAIGLKGAVTLQFIHDLDTKELLLMEINPRLGGGAVATVNAGLDIASLIVGDLFAEVQLERKAVPGVETVRFLDDVVFFPDER